MPFSKVYCHNLLLWRMQYCKAESDTYNNIWALSTQILSMLCHNIIHKACYIHSSICVLTIDPGTNNCSSVGEVKLRDGVTQFEGRVEVCLDGHWGTICSSSWRSNNARVVCGQLGFPTSGET